MSPPIRDGSGSSIGSIRLGDGSEISEVRTGAGDVLFSAIPDGVVDNFEATLYEDQGNTLTDYYGGDTNNFSRVTTSAAVYEGSYGLEATSNGGNFSINSTAGLPIYPQQGNTIQARLRFPDTTERAGFQWASQDESGYTNMSCYQFYATANEDEIILYRYDSGTRTQLDQTSVNLSTGTWYLQEVQWGTDNSMVCTIYDDTDTQLAQVSATDSTYTSGGIGWHTTAQGSGASYHDNYVVL